MGANLRFDSLPPLVYDECGRQFYLTYCQLPNGKGYETENHKEAFDLPIPIHHLNYYYFEWYHYESSQ